MKDFSFCVPTRFIVGKDSPAHVGEQIAAYGGHRVLIVDDGGSYLTELLKTVRASIAREGLEAYEIEHKAVFPGCPSSWKECGSAGRTISISSLP